VSSPHRRDRATALLLDLDGVVRWYDPDLTSPAERRYGLAPGTVLRTALEPARLMPAITGKVSRAEWLTGVAEALADRVGGADMSRSLVVEWDAYRGTVVPQVLAFVREMRQSGVPVGLATNATDDLALDLAALGLASEFDAVVSSALLGVPKPAPEFFAAACDAVGAPADRCLFVDDDERNVRGARAAGLSAFRFTRLDDLAYLRAALGR
jgi:putative hydrolase of the HAD superfamily